MYMTRQLSFTGVTFDIKELPLSRDFIEMYNDSVKLVSVTCVLIKMVQNSFLLSISSYLQCCQLVNYSFCKIIMDIFVVFV